MDFGLILVLILYTIDFGLNFVLILYAMNFGLILVLILYTIDFGLNFTVILYTMDVVINFVLILHTMDFGLIFILILYTKDFDLIFILILYTMDFGLNFIVILYTMDFCLILVLILYTIDFDLIFILILYTMDFGLNFIVILYTMDFCLILVLILYTIDFDLIFILIQQEDSRRRRTERKAALDVSIIIAVFLLCFLPTWVVGLSLQIVKNSNVPSEAVLVTSCIFTFSSVCNPIIYSTHKRDFRTAVKKTFLRTRIAPQTNPSDIDNSVTGMSKLTRSASHDTVAPTSIPVAVFANHLQKSWSTDSTLRTALNS